MYAKIPAKLQKKSNIHKFYEINSIFANTELESFYFTMQKNERTLIALMRYSIALCHLKAFL